MPVDPRDKTWVQATLIRIWVCELAINKAQIVHVLLLQTVFMKSSAYAEWSHTVGTGIWTGTSK